MSLLSIVDNVSRELQLGSVMTVVGNTDRNVQQFFALARREGKHLVKRAFLQELIEEAELTTLAQEDQGDINTIAPGYERAVPETGWNRTQQRQLIGPISPSEWQDIKATNFAPTLPHFRVRGDKFLMFPTPVAGEAVFFEYYSQYWAKSSGGTLLTDMTNDGDTARIDEDIIELGVIWRWFEAKGLDYAEKKRDYEVALKNYQLGNSGQRLKLGRGRRRRHSRDDYVVTGA